MISPGRRASNSAALSVTVSWQPSSGHSQTNATNGRCSNSDRLPSLTVRRCCWSKVASRFKAPFDRRPGERPAPVVRSARAGALPARRTGRGVDRVSGADACVARLTSGARRYETRPHDRNLITSVRREAATCIRSKRPSLSSQTDERPTRRFRAARRRPAVTARPRVRRRASPGRGRDPGGAWRQCRPP